LKTFITCIFYYPVTTFFTEPNCSPCKQKYQPCSLLP